MLFVLVGAEVDIGYAAAAGLAAVATVLGVLCFRAVGVLLCVAGSRLSGRERRIVEMRFGILPETEEKTQKEVADILGISQSYISRLEKKIMRRLKKEISKMM